MSRTANYFKGLSTGYLATVANILVGLWLTPFTLRFLDREEYALFTLACDLLMWLGLLDLGITSGLNAQAARLAGKPDSEKLNRLASTAFYTQNVIVFLMFLAGFVLSLGFPRFFPVRAELGHTASVLMGVLVLTSALGFSTNTFSALLIANQQIHIDNLLKLGSLAIRTTVTVILMKLGWGLYSLAAASLVSTLVISILAVVRTFHLLPGLKIRRCYFSGEVLKSLMSVGIWFTVGGIAGIIISSLDRLVTAKLISLESVTTLSLTGKIYVLSKAFLDQITNTARPMLGQLLGQDRMHDAAQAYHQLFTISTGVSMVAAAAIWAGNEAFVTRWVGGHNYGGWALDLACALNLLANCWVLPNRAALSAGLYKVPQHALSRIGQALVCFPLALILGRHFGLVGIAIATVLSELLVSCWYLPWLTSQMFGQPFFRFHGKSMGPQIVCGLLLAPIAWCGRQLCDWVGSGYLGAGVGGMAVVVLGFPIFWSFGLNTESRAQLVGRSMSLWLRLGMRTKETKV